MSGRQDNQILYDAAGNNQYKSDAGYHRCDAARFNRLTNTANPTSKVADRTLTFVYGPEHQRVRQDVRLSANAPSHMEAGTTWYYNGADSQGLSYEKEVKANGTICRLRMTARRGQAQGAGRECEPVECVVCADQPLDGAKHVTVGAAGMSASAGSQGP